MKGAMLVLTTWFMIGGIIRSIFTDSAMPMIVMFIILGILGKVAATLDGGKALRGTPAPDFFASQELGPISARKNKYDSQ